MNFLRNLTNQLAIFIGLRENVHENSENCVTDDDDDYDDGDNYIDTFEEVGRIKRDYAFEENLINDYEFVEDSVEEQLSYNNSTIDDELYELKEELIGVLEFKPNTENFNGRIPASLKVELMLHQIYAISWLKWREETTPFGSILADDMGLGKTLTVLSYLSLIKEDLEENNFKCLKTLIIVPASLLLQWKSEIENRFERNSFNFYLYHGASRKTTSTNLEERDLVFTTYEIVAREVINEEEHLLSMQSTSPLQLVKWERIILDEAHRIRNQETQVSGKVCALKSKYRIAMTGTIIQNSLFDFFSLVKFLNVKPLNNKLVWKHVFGSEDAPKVTVPVIDNCLKEKTKLYNQWLLLLSECLILRRLKTDKYLINGIVKPLVSIPNKSVEIVRINLNEIEKFIYEKIYDEFGLSDHLKKLIEIQSKKLLGVSASYAEVYVYLLRLRQACLHLNLLSKCLNLGELRKMLDYDEQMQSLSLENSDNNLVNIDFTLFAGDLKKYIDVNFMSSKLIELFKIIERLFEVNDDKIIIVSQWTSMLEIVGYHLDSRNIKFCEIRGEVSLTKRNEIVNQFNFDQNSKTKVMLLSLNAGGVGLNLIGANYMFILDVHWNPALEQQVCDRIFRVGQKKDVTIYKFICNHTIEVRIEKLQNYKSSISDRLSSPHLVYGKTLTLDDIIFIFQGGDINNNHFM